MQAFAQAKTDVHTFSVGKKFTNSQQDWAKEVIDEPSPLRYSLTSLTDLLSDPHTRSRLGISQAQLNAFSGAIRIMCQWPEFKSGQDPYGIDVCKPPPSDKPLVPFCPVPKLQNVWVLTRDISPNYSEVHCGYDTPLSQLSLSVNTGDGPAYVDRQLMRIGCSNSLGEPSGNEVYVSEWTSLTPAAPGSEVQVIFVDGHFLQVVSYTL